MLEDLQRRNFAPSTIRYYIRTVRDFAAYFHKPPDQLGAEQFRQFQLHMLRDQKLATIRYAADQSAEEASRSAQPRKRSRS
jgi:hypothetical protein